MEWPGSSYQQPPDTLSLGPASTAAQSVAAVDARPLVPRLTSVRASDLQGWPLADAGQR